MSRQAKKALPVFTYEELAASPSMSGLVSFLNLPTRGDTPGVHQLPPQVVPPLGVDSEGTGRVIESEPSSSVEPLGVQQLDPEVVPPLGVNFEGTGRVIESEPSSGVAPLGVQRLDPEVVPPLGVNFEGTGRVIESEPSSSVEPLGAQRLDPKVASPLGVDLFPGVSLPTDMHPISDDSPLGVHSLAPKGGTPLGRDRGLERKPTFSAAQTSNDIPLGVDPLPPEGVSPLVRQKLTRAPAKRGYQFTPRGPTPPISTTFDVEALAPVAPSGGYTPRVPTPSGLYKLSPKQISHQWVSLSTGVIYDVSRVSRVDIAQQSMALGEERFYETIWRCAGSYTFHIIEESKHIHTFRAGVLALSKIARLNIKTIKDLLPKLIEKKILRVIAEGDVRTNLGKTYEIYSYEEILRRQEESGLTFVIKNGRAVEFVQPGAAPGGGTPLAIHRSTAPRGETPPPREHPQRLGVMPLYRPRGDTTPHIDIESNTRQTTTVRSLLQTQLPTFDDSAVEHLWTDCRRRVPDVTPDEVRCLFSAKLPQSFARGIENRNGFLLRVVAVSCTPAAIAELRQSRELGQTDSTGGAGNDLISSEDEIVRLEEMLDAMPNHPQAGEWQKTIASLRKQDE
jgi:hypothetical protein